LLQQIRKILATDREWRLCIVGMEDLGLALTENENFRKRGYRFMAAFDSDPEKVGKKLPCGLVIEPLKKIKEVTRSRRIDLGVITTSAGEAQRVADILMDAGVKAILNFAAIQVRSLECCEVENVDFTVKLENLAYHLAKIR
jgi:redox-sensing transcriptional repressor